MEGLQRHRVVGGATFLGLYGGFTVSRPLARLVVGDDDLSVDVRLTLLKRLSRLTYGGDETLPLDEPLWQASWPMIVCATMARRSVVLERADGLACRFNVARRARLQPLREALDQHGVEVVGVATTIPYLFGRALRGQ
jgi:hypothetical protein